MYAIIADSGTQFKVEEGQQLEVAYRDVHKGDQITFDRVLCIGGQGETTIGRPVIEGAAVTAEVVGITQGPKLVIRKYKKRKDSRTKKGHRQKFLQLKIDKIEA